MTQTQIMLSFRKGELAKWDKYQFTPAEAIKLKFNVDISPEGALPARDGDGKELSRGARKAIPSEFARQALHHAAYQEKLRTDPQFRDALQAEIERLEEAFKAEIIQSRQ